VAPVAKILATEFQLLAEAALEVQMAVPDPLTAKTLVAHTVVVPAAVEDQAAQIQADKVLLL
jgi:hypothetical protein